MDSYWHKCRFAYEKNNNAQFINCDITSLTGEQLEALYPDNTTKILVGCAPCQPFSKYTNRYRKDGPTDDKWKLLYSFARLVQDVNPEIISMENVPELEKETVFSDLKEAHLEDKISYFSTILVNKDNKIK